MDEVKKKKLLKDVTITHVSYVKRGANRRQFFLAKDECVNPDIQFDVKFFAKNDEENDEKKLLYGIVYEPDVEDAHGDFMESKEIEKTAHEFLEHYRNVDTEHNMLAGAGVVVESYIAPKDLYIGTNVVKSGSWILVTRANDEIWEAWKEGEITGYSMFGVARETQMSKGESKVKSLIRKALEALGIKKSFEETLDEIINSLTSNPLFIIDVMQEDFFKSVAWDALSEEQLVALSKSMRSAAEFIDKKVSGIIKTDDAEPKAETETEQDSVKTPNNDAEPVEKPDSTEDNVEKKPDKDQLPEPDEDEEDETEPENDNEEEKEPEMKVDVEEPEKAGNIQNEVDTIAEKLQESLNGAILKMEKRLDEKIDKLQKELDTTNEKLNETRTDSIVKVAPQRVEPKQSGYGLV